MTEHYDVIVIGSGAGGGTADPRAGPHREARSCCSSAATGCRASRRTGTPSAVWVDKRYANSGKWTDAATGKQFTPKQHYYVGGNTKVYGAILFRFRERDFGEIQHVDGVSPAWPIGYRGPGALVHPGRAALPGARRARRRPDRAARPPTPYPFPAISHEPRIAQLTSDLAGRRAAPVPAAQRHPASTRPRRERSACIRCATCDGYACLINGKADAAGHRVEPALRYPNVTLLTGALVTRLETDSVRPLGDRVVVERDGATERYSADVVVVAGGAINSAALLLRSATTGTRTAWATRPAGRGRNLMLHNNSSLIAFSQDAEPDEVPEDVGHQRLLLRRPGQRLALPARRDADARQERRDADRLRRARTPPTRPSSPGTRWTSGSPPRTCRCPTTG